jgi:hypothetical protein
VPWDVEAIKTVLGTRYVTTANVKIHVKLLEFAAQMLCVNSITMSHPANAPLGLKVTQHLSKAVFVSRLHVWPQINVLRVICVLPINVMYLALTTCLVLLANDVLTIFVRKFVTQTTIACLEKFVTIREHVNLDVHLTVTVQQLKYVWMANVNVDQDLFQHHSDVLILTNVLANHAIPALVVKIRRVPLDVYVRKKPLAILTVILDVYNQINVVVMLNVLIIWLVCKENAQILALLLNADVVLNANQLIIKHCAIAHQVI